MKRIYSLGLAMAVLAITTLSMEGTAGAANSDRMDKENGVLYQDTIPRKDRNKDTMRRQPRPRRDTMPRRNKRDTTAAAATGADMLSYMPRH